MWLTYLLCRQMKIFPDRCYVCGFGRNSVDARKLYFHNIPCRTNKRAVLDKWLTFLKLPPHNEWDDSEWRKISLCSLHFTENDYPPRYNERFRVTLVAGAVPTKNPPTHTSIMSKMAYSKAKPSLAQENMAQLFAVRNMTSGTMEDELAATKVVGGSPGSNASKMTGCSAPNCTRRSERGVRLFLFPRDPERRKKWVQNCRRDEWQPSSTSRLCDAHFEDCQYEHNRADGWRKLKPNAVPTIFDVPKVPKRMAHNKTLPMERENIPISCGKVFCLACDVIEGSTAYQEQHLQLFEFPSHPERVHVLSKWLKFCNLRVVCLEELKDARLCSRHFGPQDYIPGYSNGQRSLQSYAVPHIYPPEEHSAAAIDILQKNSALLAGPATHVVKEEVQGDSADDDSPGNDIKSEIEESHIQDSSHRDHDYLGTKNNTSEFHITDHGEQPLDDAHSQVLENVKKELCRICGKKGDALMPICETSFKSFKHMTDEMPLSAKIEMHLPLKVAKDDMLPLHICWTCADLLTRWHELYVTCVAADAVLRKTFGVEETVVPLDTSGAFSRSQDKADIPLTSNLPPTEQMPHEMDNPTPLNVNEKYKGSCEKCGKSCCGEAEDEQNESPEIFRNSVIHPSLLCKICREQFKSTIERRNHFIMCRQLSTICEICGVEVQHRKDLTRHKNRKHSQKIKIVTKRHMCDKCAKCFHSCCQLKNHMVVHERGPTPKHFCNFCCKTFYNEHNYDMHMKKHEEGKLQTTMNVQTFLTNESVSLYVCSVCQQTFEDPLSLVIHLTSKKEMKCPMCHKKIFNERRFILHKCKVYNCKYCYKPFCTKFECENHERIHTGEKPYKCNVCDSMFRTTRQKVRHEMRHNPDLFKCSYCNKEFKSKCVFQDHLNGHMGHFILCKICEKKFSSRKSLYKHTSKFHRNHNALS